LTYCANVFEVIKPNKKRPNKTRPASFLNSTTKLELVEKQLYEKYKDKFDIFKALRREISSQFACQQTNVVLIYACRGQKLKYNCVL
jgi:hypothetical protein